MELKIAYSNIPLKNEKLEALVVFVAEDTDILGKYTPEQYPENVGLPKPVAKNDLDYSNLVKENKVIEFK